MVIHCLSSSQAVRQTVRIVSMDHPQGILRTGDRATVTFEFISQPEFIKEGMKLLFREGKTKVRSQLLLQYLTPRLFPDGVLHAGSGRYHTNIVKTTSVSFVDPGAQPVLLSAGESVSFGRPLHCLPVRCCTLEVGTSRRGVVI